MRAWKAAILVVPLLCAATMAAQEETYRATGLIVDTDGKPIAGAKVQLYYTTLYEDVAGYREAKCVQETATGKDGQFDFKMDVKSEFQRGCYISARKPGYATSWIEWYLTADLCLDLVLGPPQTLIGDVRDVQGHCVAEASVVLNPKLPFDVRRMGTPSILTRLLFVTKTDSMGRFSFPDVPEVIGYSLEVDAPECCHYDSGLKRRGRDFDQGSTETKAIHTSIVLEQAGQISGRVINKADGKAVAGICIRTDDWDKALTDAEGRFLIKHVSSGTHSIKLESEERSPGWKAELDSITVRAGHTTEGIVVRAEPLPFESEEPAWLEMAVADDERRPIHQAAVKIYGHYPYTTDVNGIAQISLDPGEIIIVGIGKTGYWTHHPLQVVRTERGRSVRREFTLRRAPRAEGIVLDEAFKPVSGVQIASVAKNNSYECYTGKDGRFGFFHDAHRMNPDMVCYDLVAIDVNGNRAVVYEADNPQRDMVIRLKPAVEIVAQIAGTDGALLDDVWCRMYLQYEDLIIRPGMRHLPVSRDGRLSVRGVPPGLAGQLEVNAKGHESKKLEFKSPLDTSKPYDLGQIELEVWNE